MIVPINGLFETHLTVAALQLSMDFYGGILVLLGHKDTDADGTQDCPLRIGRILRRYDSTACQSTSRERDL